MNLAEQLALEEGNRRYAYQDGRGYWTIGIGRCIDARVAGTGLTPDEVLYLFRNDLAKVMTQAETIPLYRTLSPVRRDVILDMAFNVGLTGVQRFKKMWAAIGKQQWDKAGAEILDSTIAPARAKRLARMMATDQPAEA